MKRAHQRNAVREQKFYFRKTVFQRRSSQFTNGWHGTNGWGPHSRTHSRSSSHVGSPISLERGLSPSGSIASDSREGSRCSSPEGLPRIEDEYEEFTINEIINGKPGTGSSSSFPGLLGLVYSYMNSLNIDVGTRSELAKYFELIRMRADGRLKTTAAWMREFVRAHPAYKQDSVVSQEINFDLIHAIDEIERGVRPQEDLLGEPAALRWLFRQQSLTCSIQAKITLVAITTT